MNIETVRTENHESEDSDLLVSPALSLDQNDQIKWFIQLRWIAVLVATALVFLSVDVLEILPLSVRVPLFVSVGVLIVLNTAYTVLLRTGRRAILRGPFQAYADLVLPMTMLHFSEGISPLPLGRGSSFRGLRQKELPAYSHLTQSPILGT